MKIKIMALAACLSIPFQMVSADSASDIDADYESGMSISSILTKTISEGMSVEAAVSTMVSLHPEFVTLVVKAAITTSPEKAGKIVAAAIAAAPQFKDAIAIAAIEAGVDPTVVTAATAAGSTTAVAALNNNPAARRIARTPAPGAVSGGGVASPN